jgi:hypothetical protein
MNKSGDLAIWSQHRPDITSAERSEYYKKSSSYKKKKDTIFYKLQSMHFLLK